MDQTKDKHHIKKIIEEYNLFFTAWGDSDNWTRSQFKTLEYLLFEATKIQINANTLRRFFQQKTGHPQLATKDALCKFLGYSGYTDFVMKMTKPEKKAGVTELQIIFPEDNPDVDGRDFAGQETTGKKNVDESVVVGKKDVPDGNGIKTAANRTQKHIYIITLLVAAIFLYFLYAYFKRMV